MSQGGPNNVSGSGGPPIETLTGNSGGAVGPDAVFNVDLLGNTSTGIDIVGTPASNLVTVIGLAASVTQVGTVELATAIETGTLTDTTRAITPAGLEPILLSKYVVASGGAYTTIQSALDAAYADFTSTGIPQTVYIRPGPYTENLTLYEGVDLCAAGGQVDSKFTNIIGTHMLPGSGDTAIYGIWFTGTTACFNAPIGGTTKVNLFNVITEITGVGYTFDIDGFSGELNIFDYLQFDTGTNGFVYNPTGNCEVNIIFAGVGLTQNLAATAQISGNSFFQGMLVSISMNFVGTSYTQLNMGCELQGTISTADTASLDIANTYFFSGSAQAINHLSSGVITLSNVGINSSHVTPVDGTGELNLANVSFLDSQNIDPGLTLTAGASFSGVSIYPITPLTNVDNPYTTLDNDSYLSCDTSLGVLTILLPNAPVLGRVYTVKDSTGSAAVSNITVTTVGGVINIDGATTFVMNTNYEAANFIFNGSTYEVF